MNDKRTRIAGDQLISIVTHCGGYGIFTDIILSFTEISATYSLFAIAFRFFALLL